MPRQDLSETAARLGVTLEAAEANSPAELDGAFADFANKGVHGVFVGADPVFVGLRKHIIGLAQRYGLPAIYELKVFADDDGLISYGPSAPEAYRQAGLYTARILKGDNPAAMPVLQPSKFELVINLRTAKALSLHVPEALLARADEVIE
jgi:putative ABC transport system substrate-binding protein